MNAFFRCNHCGKMWWKSLIMIYNSCMCTYADFLKIDTQQRIFRYGLEPKWINVLLVMLKTFHWQTRQRTLHSKSKKTKFFFLWSFMLYAELTHKVTKLLIFHFHHSVHNKWINQQKTIFPWVAFPGLYKAMKRIAQSFSPNFI